MDARKTEPSGSEVGSTITLYVVVGWVLIPSLMIVKAMPISVVSACAVLVGYACVLLLRAVCLALLTQESLQEFGFVRGVSLRRLALFGKWVVGF